MIGSISNQGLGCFPCPILVRNEFNLIIFHCEMTRISIYHLSLHFTYYKGHNSMEDMCHLVLYYKPVYILALHWLGCTAGGFVGL